jgi:acetyltransferase-like isoleucine patch superfamily enzyme
MEKPIMNILIHIRDIITNIIIIFGPNDLKIFFARLIGVKIGKNCRIFTHKFGSELYLISIGDNCEITSGVTFITHDGVIWVFRKDKKFTGTKFGTIIIRKNCMIGVNSILLPNIEIGPNSIVGAGSVVTKTIPPNSVYAGNPAKFICTLDQFLINCKSKDTGKISSKNKRKVLSKKFENRFEQIIN